MTSLLLKFLILATILPLLLYANNGSKSHPNPCFCKLQGEVDDCSCKVENLDSLNNRKIYPILKSLLQRDYFRYFKVNLMKPCPFWSDDSRCALKDCHVQSCSEDEVPEGLKANGNGNSKEINKYSEEAQKEHNCDQERELSALDRTISAESLEAFKNWTRHDDRQETFCEIDDDDTPDCQYVDLLLNPERYTGYKGASPHRIWNSIYEENCFKPEGTVYGSKKTLAGLCLEQRAFYRLISGLHTSINLHLCNEYLFPSTTLLSSPEFRPNTEEFIMRFDPKATKGQGPQRLKNLYFTYLVALRALAKAAPYLEEEEFFTGSPEEEKDIKDGIKDLLKIVKSFPDHFDESNLFKGDSKVAKKLLTEFREHFRNISRIMDCVGCDKCKLWGKLQIQGMGTALKILFSGDSVGLQSTVNANHKQRFQLRRTEIVSLFNAFGRLSSSIHTIEKFRKLTS
ncbi:ERO1-like protein beta isoform X2 [Ostrea edulis]|uniref:ERO1-like protein beta isoform X2 n=1 Tax=Ostrea edulis TaxID=37623 RepID=UPI002095A251|nr:ERO1-like protein beta isoform X2 [Ostrea edulis]